MNPPAHYIPAVSHAGVAQLVERQLPKLNVVGSSPITRFYKSIQDNNLGADTSCLSPVWMPLWL
jgi:hypothetical protein